MKRQTSLTAFYEVQQIVGFRQTQVYEAFESLQNATNSEIADWLDWSINRVTPRTYELRELEMLEFSERRTCQVTGRKAIAWRIKRKRFARCVQI